MNSSEAGVAIIGMSCRFPGVRGPAQFWDLLVAGRSTVGRFPENRVADVGTPSHPDAVTLTTGSFLAAVDGFDAPFFDIGPAEAAAMDPVQRLGLELAWEAVEDAGIPAGALAGREVDVVVSTAPSGYDRLRHRSGSDRDDHYAALGSSGALIANRISSLFDVRGMSFCADSGQSSSLVSLALSCERIRSGAVDTALVGGVHLITDPEAGVSLLNLGALSPDGCCRTFDDRADGFVRGEGGAFVLLKRLDLARADGDHVYAVVSGWGVANGGATSRMPDPSPSGQAAATLAALDSATADFADVGYLEAHGTGTRLGDPAELAGLREVFVRTGRTRPLAIGSVKTNVGHLEPAAGIAGLVKAALCVDRGLLVPSLNFRSANAAVADFTRDFEVPVESRPWPGVPGRPRLAGVSSFGMGGTTAHVLLSQAFPVRAEAEPVGPARPGPLPWVLSARSVPALQAQAARLRDLLIAGPAPAPADVAHALLTTRSRFEHRAVVIAGDHASALAGLDEVAAGRSTARVVRGETGAPPGPVVFVFPGQGTQWSAMGRSLYAESSVFAQAVDECAEAFRPWLDWSLVDVLTGARDAVSLDRIEVIQPALFTMMVALARLWHSLGVRPDAVVGHSQGEIAAAYVAGAVSLADAARIVAARSKALAGLAGSGGMIAVAASPDWVRERLAGRPGRLSVAAHNGPTSVVVSGEVSALDAFTAEAAAEGVRVRRIKVDLAGHSQYLEPLRDRLLAETAGIAAAESAIRFYSTVTGDLFDTRGLDSAHWYANMRSTVRFAEAVDRLVAEPGAVFVEVGPHPVLQVAIAEAAEARGTAPLVTGTISRDDGDLGRVYAALAELYVRGLPADWSGTVPGVPARRTDLPLYPFQRQRYWLTAEQESLPARSGSGLDLGTPQAVLDVVCAETAALLGASDAGASVAARVTEKFRDLGLDSASALRLRNRLSAVTGTSLSATVVFTYPTPRDLADHIVALLTPAETVPADAAAPAEAAGPGVPGTDDDLFALIDRGYV